METHVCFDCEAGGEVGGVFEEMKQSTAIELRMNVGVDGMGRGLFSVSLRALPETDISWRLEWSFWYMTGRDGSRR